MAAVEDFMDVGNILGKSWVSLYQVYDVRATPFEILSGSGLETKNKNVFGVREKK